MNSLTPHQPNIKIGCLWVIFFIALLYFGNAARLMIPNAINRAKWEQQGITHYEATVDVFALSPFMGQNKIFVQDGEVVEANSNCEDCIPSAYQSLTIEDAFEIPSGCFFPLVICTYQYDSEYGFPKYSGLNACLLPISECRSSTKIYDFKPLD